jgi:hypothetical protein
MVYYKTGASREIGEFDSATQKCARLQRFLNAQGPYAAPGFIGSGGD